MAFSMDDSVKALIRLIFNREDLRQDSDIFRLYSSLHTEIAVLNRHSRRYSEIRRYVENTHSPLHNKFKLRIERVFQLRRKVEDQRYKRFAREDCRMMLWHGSPTSDYVGLFSKGLRISPPEAPSVSSMFGRGIYFADMVSKAANYCQTSPIDPTGLLLLCEVALGDMREAKIVADYSREKRCVIATGERWPDPNFDGKTPSGIIIPYGNIVNSGVDGPLVRHNEYVVHDERRVKLRFCVQMHFEYK